MEVYMYVRVFIGVYAWKLYVCARVYRCICMEVMLCMCSVFIIGVYAWKFICMCTCLVCVYAWKFICMCACL